MKNQSKILCAALLMLTMTTLAFGAPPMPQGNVPDSVEFAALHDIYTSLTGSGWTDHTNWPSSWPSTATSAE
jgi:hypothetical protein